MGEIKGNSGLIAFPGKAILSPAEAAALLGISRVLLWAMHLLRCGPASIRVRRRRLYTREELNGFRSALLSAFGVTAAAPASNRWQPAHSLSAGAQGSLGPGGGLFFTPRQGDATGPAASLDPLMAVLCHHRVRHRLIVTGLWGLLVIGGVMSLTLF